MTHSALSRTSATQHLYAERLFDGEHWLTEQLISIEYGRISTIAPYSTRQHAHLSKQDSTGLIAPGFIDIHVNGGGGVLFNHQPNAEALAAIVKAHSQFGTVALLPTLITDDDDVMQRAHQAICQALGPQQIAGILGVHYEGPYLNPLRKGVHHENKIRPANPEFFAPLLKLPDEGKVLVTLAPELAPAGFIQMLAAQGVRVSAGHTAASYAQIQQALAQGVSGFTHLFNAMSPLTSREPGVVGAALDDRDSWCGMIVDGHHIHPAVMRTAVRAKGSERIMLVTDAIHSVGYSQRELSFLGKAVLNDNGKVTTLDGTLAGSDLDMASAVRNTLHYGLGDETAVLQMASRNPAQYLRVSHRLGYLRPGYQASMVCLDNNWQVIQCWINGQYQISDSDR
ncbi:N-acetylglucosamine-6-phosphate deacetylase [Pokkaliibacter plantistimulans]|uniref:N-acetylglucosamine-6-phosphate deacetylase n=1 Tax=Proteobacteria bacterium 228 TaxID=2083153 RepID=A0A2S5KHX1_9PROT|nr:N-acetylglucosamine-6-phosphate deacetylase [Pokkaliibacter plantistimulans]PPC74352.1 N-acetylglucosamine-6-phosphate deacetylase [Pokkaliibacter plantistimulans]